MDRRFIGSNVALVFGLFLLFNIFAPPGEYPYAVDAFIDGLCIIAGALAYKSAKKRKLGIVKNAKYRQYTEIIGLALIVILAGLLLIKRHNFYARYTVIVWAVSS